MCTWSFQKWYCTSNWSHKKINDTARLTGPAATNISLPLGECCEIAWISSASESWHRDRWDFWKKIGQKQNIKTKLDWTTIVTNYWLILGHKKWWLTRTKLMSHIESRRTSPVVLIACCRRCMPIHVTPLASRLKTVIYRSRQSLDSGFQLETI